MSVRLDNPLFVQGDHTLLLEVDNPRYEEARDHLALFAELIKSPEHLHTYRLTPLSIWNACASGMSAKEIANVLKEYSKYDVPPHIEVEVKDYASRYGRLKIFRRDDVLHLEADDKSLAEEIWHQKGAKEYLEKRIGLKKFVVLPRNRGRLKQALVKVGFPAEDLAGYVEGERLDLQVREKTLSGNSFLLRPYQKDAVDVFYAGGADSGGSGVVVLPCGAGKTIVGIGTMARLGVCTLILTTGTTAVHQWMAELLDKTNLPEDCIGEYTGRCKNIKPVTVTTYQILTYRKSKKSDFEHFALFDERNWGLIIYDEVHLLPAPVFQVTADIQARRRLGVTATLVREDGREDDVFALIGPKKVDIPWKVMEKQGWIAKASCTEVRLFLPEDLKMTYAVASKRSRFRIAAENPLKINVVRRLLNKHKGDSILIIGTYIEQLSIIAKKLNVPVLMGKTGQKKRDELFADFRAGKLRILVVSKVANFAVDLPDASVAIQVSGSFGSRQEEAQRLGRLLRPKKGENQAHFYTIVTRESVEQDFALNRQLFLCEQGYCYNIVDEESIEQGSTPNT